MVRAFQGCSHSSQTSTARYTTCGSSALESPLQRKRATHISISNVSRSQQTTNDYAHLIAHQVRCSTLLCHIKRHLLDEYALEQVKQRSLDEQPSWL
jgi:hypothetical protein